MSQQQTPEPQGPALSDDYEWAHERVVSMAASAYADARVHGLKLLKGFGYPDEVMRRAQDYRALSIILEALRELQQRRATQEPDWQKGLPNTFSLIPRYKAGAYGAMVEDRDGKWVEAKDVENMLEDARPEYQPQPPQGQPPEPQGWQPISSAPRDFTRVLVWGPRIEGVQTAQYGRHSVPQATHWMPLPAPPEVTR